MKTGSTAIQYILFCWLGLIITIQHKKVLPEHKYAEQMTKFIRRSKAAPHYLSYLSQPISSYPDGQLFGCQYSTFLCNGCELTKEKNYLSVHYFLYLNKIIRPFQLIHYTHCAIRFWYGLYIKSLLLYYKYLPKHNSTVSENLHYGTLSGG